MSTDPKEEKQKPDPVTEASEESFPASDAPSWTGTVAADGLPEPEDDDAAAEEDAADEEE